MASSDSLTLVLEDLNAGLSDRIQAALVLGKSHRNSDEAIAYFQTMNALSQEANDLEKEALSELQIGFVYHNRSVFDTSIMHYQKSLDLYQNVEENNQSALVLRNLGRISSKRGEWVEAIKYYERAMIREEADGNQAGIASLLNLMGSINRKQKQFPEAIEYFQRSYEIAVEEEAIGTQVDALGNLATTYREIDSTELTVEYFEKTLALSREYGLDRRTAVCVMTLGQIAHLDGKPEIAKRYLEEANELYVKLGNERGTGTIKSALGEVALLEGRVDDAVSYCEKAYALIQKTKNKTALKTCLSCLVKAYEGTGDFQGANAYFKELDNLKTEMYAESKVKEVTELEMNYAFEKEKEAAAVLQAQKDARQVWVRNGLILGLLGLSVIGFLIYRSSRQRKKTNELLSEKNDIISKALSEKELLLKEIHHRVKNNLQVISSLLSMQSRFIEDETAIEAIKGGRDRVKSMALIHQNLYQEDNLTGIEVQDYFQKLARSLFQSYNIEPDRISLKLDVEPLNLDVDTVIPLGLVVNELMSNALKHAFPNGQKGEIHVRLREEESENQPNLILEVIDNGVGMQAGEPTEFSDSFGYRMIHAFKDKLEAKLNFIGKDGTQVRMMITDYKKVG